MTGLLVVAAVTLVPWIELRGAIPLGMAMGFHPLAVFAVAVAANCLVILPGFLALDLLYERWWARVPWVRRQVERVRAQGGRFVERYELLGLALFVAVPLPGTGAYSGTLLAWLLGLERRRAGAAIAAGVVGAGIVVTLAVTGVASFLRLVR
ncbi:MAG TPA: small multi-drug export protein [bacterium]